MHATLASTLGKRPGDHPVYDSVRRASRLKAEPFSIDALYYPHVIDSIFEDAVEHMPLQLRLVCQDWRTRVDTECARWLSIDMSLPGYGSADWPAPPPASRIDDAASWLEEQDLPEPYSWLISSVRLPTLDFMRLSMAKEGHYVPPHRLDLRPQVDFVQDARMLDIRPCVEWVRNGPLIPFQSLDTVRFQQEKYRGVGINAALSVPHARRVIFKDGPYTERAHEQALDERGCTDPDCTRGHTERIVVNARTPVLNTGADEGPVIEGLRELVVIFHGWRIIPQWDIRWLAEFPADPVNDIRLLVVEAAAHGTQVTVVNADLLDLKTRRCLSNYNKLRPFLTDFLQMDTQWMERDRSLGLDVDEVLGRVEWLTLDEYIERVGEEEFKIETMTDEFSRSEH